MPAPARAEPEFPLPRTVAITGIAGNLGKALAKLLHTQARLVGIDRRPFREKPKDLEHHQLDVRKKKVEDVFRDGFGAATFGCFPRNA